MRISKYKEYNFNKNKDGDLMAEAHCDHYSYHADAKVYVLLDKHFDKKVIVKFRKNGKLYSVNILSNMTQKQLDLVNKKNHTHDKTCHEHLVKISLKTQYEYYKSLEG